MARAVPISRIRNIGVMAHIDAGKTTTTERVLFYSGYLHKLGEVDDGTAFMDYMEQEKERGITIQSAAVTAAWKDYQINIIDTPGHVDFTSEVQRSLRVLDGAIAVFCAVGGVEPQSERVWRQADEFKVPRIIYVNKLDRMGANFDRVLSMLVEKLSANPIAIQFPMGAEENFEGVVDLIKMKSYYFDTEQYGAEYEITDISEKYIKQAEQYRALLLEKVAELDDSLTEKFLLGEDLTEDEIKTALRNATLKNLCNPVFCGSSLKNIGVQPLLDGVLDYLPSPEDVGNVLGFDAKDHEKLVDIQMTDDEAFTALSFKVLTDPFVGKMNFLRIYSGSLKVGQQVENTAAGKKEKISKIYKIYSKRHDEISEAYSGEIVAVPQLKFTSTGDTLAINKNVIFDTIRFLDPMIDMSLEAKTLAEQDKLLVALGKLSEEDPTFKFSNDADRGQIIISGVGELQLEIAVERLKREFNVEARAGKPQVSYRETISSAIEERYIYERSHAGKNQFGDVKIHIVPNGESTGNEFFNTVEDKKIPKVILEAAEKGVKESMQIGMQGYPLQDVKITLLSCEYIDGVTTELGTKIAASIAVKEALRKAGTQLLEPIFRLEIISPEQYVGDIISDLNSRKGRIEQIDAKSNLQVVDGFAPLSNLFGYVTSLRSLSQGRASFTMTFSHYSPASKTNIY
ncbi:MAG: translation elongation factor G [Ignavibacteria bacterium GWF2_33_9]|nr:MAG: translation elongation factor G [Ignavibacteria bacterium GWF2_33_9]